MSAEFWIGLLVWPVGGAALLGAAWVFTHTWEYLTKWAAKRNIKLEAARPPEVLGGDFEFWAAGQLNGRGVFAGLMLTSNLVRIIALSENKAIIFMDTTGASRAAERKLFTEVLNETLDRLAREAEAERRTHDEHETSKR